MKLSDFVVPDAILPNLQVESKEAAIRAMVGSLKKAARFPQTTKKALSLRF